MSPVASALIAAAETFVVGGALNVLAVRLRWLPRFLWLAAVAAPFAVGCWVYWVSWTDARPFP